MSQPHVKIGIVSLALALLLAIPTWWIASRPAPAKASVDIAVEHTSPVTITFVKLASSGTTALEVSQSGSGSIMLHLPAHWRRDEVRGVPLSSITSEVQEQNYIRWVLPARAIVRYSIPGNEKIMLHNPSGIPLTVKTTIVDVAKGIREDDATIVTTDPLPFP